MNLAVDAPILHAPPLSLYVHLPWCIRKCPYCDFNSHAVTDDGFPERDYVAALLADLDLELPRVWGRSVVTVFLGGGTPSLFHAESIERLLSGIRARLRLRPGAEVTMEVNPGAADSARLADFVGAGITRFSVGVQSFDDRALGAIGRVHDATAARDAIEAALTSGASKVNADLMFALPNQTREAAARDLSQAIACGVGHVSYYHLTLEPNTAFYRSPPPLPDHDLAFAMYQDGRERLANAGLGRYEVSAYARSGERSQHNLNVWCFGDYLGIGAGAHGKITNAPMGEVLRSVKRRHPRQYMDGVSRGAPDLRRSAVPVDDLAFEFLLNALRLEEGFELSVFEHRTGHSREILAPLLHQAQADGLLRCEDDRVRTSEQGGRFLDDLLARFLPQRAAPIAAGDSSRQRGMSM